MAARIPARASKLAVPVSHLQAVLFGLFLLPNVAPACLAGPQPWQELGTGSELVRLQLSQHRRPPEHQPGVWPPELVRAACQEVTTKRLQED